MKLRFINIYIFVILLKLVFFQISSIECENNCDRKKRQNGISCWGTDHKVTILFQHCNEKRMFLKRRQCATINFLLFDKQPNLFETIPAKMAHRYSKNDPSEPFIQPSSSEKAPTGNGHQIHPPQKQQVTAPLSRSDRFDSYQCKNDSFLSIVQIEHPLRWNLNQFLCWS